MVASLSWSELGTAQPQLVCFFNTLHFNKVKRKWNEHFLLTFFTPAMFTNIKSNECNARRVFEQIQKNVQNWIKFENIISLFSSASTFTELVEHY